MQFVFWQHYSTKLFIQILFFHNIKEFTALLFGNE
jgi:hypothetical protein